MSTEEVTREVHAVLDGVDVPPPDPARLLARAHRSRGRRARRSWVLVAAFVVVLGAAVTFVVRGSGEAETADDPDAYVAGTSQALAALAIEHLDLESDVTARDMDEMDEIGGTDDPESDGALSAYVELDDAPSKQLGSALMLSTGGEPEEGTCDGELDGCVDVPSARGEVSLMWQDEWFYGVTWVDPDSGDFELVGLTGVTVGGDPRESGDVPHPVDDLVALLTDERYGVMTTRALVDAELPGWSDAGHWSDDGAELAEDVEDPLAGEVTAMLQTHLGVRARRVEGWTAGKWSAGAYVDLRGQPAMSIVLTVGAGPAVNGPPCLEGFIECETRIVAAGEVTIGRYADDELGSGLMVWLQHGDEMRSAQLGAYEGNHTSDVPPDPDLPISVDQLVALLGDPGMSLR